MTRRETMSLTRVPTLYPLRRRARFPFFYFFARRTTNDYAFTRVSSRIFLGENRPGEFLHHHHRPPPLRKTPSSRWWRWRRSSSRSLDDAVAPRRPATRLGVSLAGRGGLRKSIFRRLSSCRKPITPTETERNRREYVANS